MAAPARPNVNVDYTNSLTVYQSLDAIDEAIFNRLATQYERAAFIDVITTWRGQFEPGFTGAQVPLVTRNDIQVMWLQKRQYKISSRKKKSMRPKPAAVADAPLPAVTLPPPVPVLPPVPLPTVVPPPVLTFSAIQPVADQPPAPPVVPPLISAPTQTTTSPTSVQTTIQTGDSGSYDTASSRRSSSSGGEIEPTFLMHNNPDVKEYLHPTKERRRSVSSGLSSDADSGQYRFVGVLAQSHLNTKDDKAIMPLKSNCLFVRHSATGLIEEQIAVKIIDLTANANLPAWTDREIEIYDLLHNTGCSHVIGYRGYRKSTQNLEGKTMLDNKQDRRHTCYIYTDYAAMGDLTDVCKAHKKHRMQVPEYFIWYVMQILVEALITLRDGNCSAPFQEPENSTSSSPWRPILHLDIKAANVFLCAPSEDYPLWPKPVLSDFDTAIRLEPEEDKRSEQIKESRQTGSMGWLPPERNFRAVDDRHRLLPPSIYPPHGWTLSEKTDIWDIGVLAYVLTRAHVTDADLEARCRKAGCWHFYDEGQGACQFMNEQALRWRRDLKGQPVLSEETACPPLENLSEEYSIRLYKQIQACMKLKPKARPTLEDLRREIHLAMMKLKYWYGPAMKNKEDRLHVSFGVHPKTDKLEDFGIGKPYRSPRKRRKVDLADNMTDEYKDAIESWDDEVRYPRPTLEEQAALSQSVENFYFKSDLLFSSKEDPIGLSKRHFCAMLKKRVDPTSSLPTDVMRNYNPEVMKKAFTDRWKRGVLRDLLNNATRAMMTDPSLGSPKLRAINALTHALEWGLLLLEARGEPNPSLRDRTLLHRGVYDYIFPE